MSREDRIQTQLESIVNKEADSEMDYSEEGIHRGNAIEQAPVLNFKNTLQDNENLVAMSNGLSV